MLTIKGSDIYIPQGDSGKLVIELIDKDTGLRAFLDEGSKIYFTIKNSIVSEKADLEKEIEAFNTGNVEIDILPQDTRDMRVKSYIYDIRIKWNTGLVDTLVRGKFIIEGSVSEVE